MDKATAAAKDRYFSILSKFERIAKTDMRYLGSGGFWLSLGALTTMVTGAATGLAYGNLISPTVYGNYKFILSVAAILGAFSLQGMPAAITRAVAQGDRGALREGFRHMLWTGLLMTAIGTGIALYYAYFGNWTVAIGVFVAALTMPLLNASNLYAAELEGTKDFRRLALTGIGYTVLPAGMMILTAALTSSALILSIAYFLSYTLAAALIYIHVARGLPTHAARATEHKKFSYHVSFVSLIGTLSENADKILIFHYVGAAELATYSFAYAVVQQLLGLRKIMKPLVSPRLAQMTIPEIKKSIVRKSMIMFAACVIVVIAYLFAAPTIFKYALPRYVHAVPYSQALSLLVLTIPLVFYRQTLYAHAMTKQIYVNKLGQPVVRLSMLFLLVPHIGIWGAVFALLAQSTYEAISLGWQFRRMK